jgi:hypothetical protein
MERHRIHRGSLAALFAVLAVTLTADGGANHQQPSNQFGTSGGNINDISRVYCCSGTLGALVSDGAALYILSNNHVLGRGGQAADGEDVSQPGLIDNGCRPGNIVADVTAYPALGSNVDAAIAELRPGLMDETGVIMDIGVPSAATLAPAVPLAVQKSGRTTGRTTGTISSINTNVVVQYQESCGIGKKFTVSYSNQIVINSSTFSAGGDSGSLILANDGSFSPVGLLFAGSSTTTIANPINEVLARVGNAHGAAVSFNLSLTGGTTPPPDGGGGGGGGGNGRGNGRGGGSGGSTGAQGGGPSLPASEVARGTAAKEAHAARLMADPAILGVGVGEDPDAPGQAVVIIYANRGQARAAIARELDGVRTRIVETDPIVAYGWNSALGGARSCKPAE